MRQRPDSDVKYTRRRVRLDPSRSTPARFEPPAAAPSDDIDEWLERKSPSARGAARRAIRRTNQAASRDAVPRDATAAAPRRAARSTVEIDRTLHHRSESTKIVSISPQAAPPRQRRPLWLRLRGLCVFLCGILFLEGVAATVSSPHFAVGEVVVEGAQETSDIELDAICTSLIGQNFLRAHRAAAEAQAKAIPTVAAASVGHDWTAWPPRLVLRVHERQPFARVGGGNSWLIVDESGMPFRVARREDQNLYAVTSPRLLPHLGKPLETAAWKPVVQFAGILKQDAARAGGWNLRRVYFDRHGFASLRLTGGQNDETLVQLGASGWSEKLQTARWALADFAAHGRHAESINLISSAVTTWTPRVPPKPKAIKPKMAKPKTVKQRKKKATEHRLMLLRLT